MFCAECAVDQGSELVLDTAVYRKSGQVPEHRGDGSPIRVVSQTKRAASFCPSAACAAHLVTDPPAESIELQPGL